jgi:hypothetical protein
MGIYHEKHEVGDFGDVEHGIHVIGTLKESKAPRLA